MATEPRRTRSNSSRRRGPKSTRLGLDSDDEDDDVSLTGLSELALSGQTSLRRSNAVRRRGNPSDRSSSRTRDTALGRTRDSNNMVSKSVRRRQTDR
ncbi:unnamed protein product [Penicillium salamii]|nr:unnamed protein product [Penicillium salamii]CAG8418712.1 unnamed protein product [Penicillium salamii]